jgi:hydroxymethylbilane synthase
VRALRPDLEILDLRGNVPTRIRKLVEGQYDAILVAEAALQRLAPDLGDLARRALAVATMVPAPGQAAMAVQMRRGDPRRARVVEAAHDETTGLAVGAERRLMSLLEGGCQLPLGAHVFSEGGGYRLLATVAPPPEPGDLPPPTAPPVELAGADLDALVSEAFEALQPLVR